MPSYNWNTLQQVEINTGECSMHYIRLTELIQYWNDLITGKFKSRGCDFEFYTKSKPSSELPLLASVDVGFESFAYNTDIKINWDENSRELKFNFPNPLSCRFTKITPEGQGTADYVSINLKLSPAMLMSISYVA